MNLEHLREGDKVFINSRHYGIAFYTIDRVTKTQIIIGKTKYNKSGYQIGNSSAWNREYIQEVTPEIIAKYNIQKLQSKLQNMSKVKVNEKNYSEIKKLVDELIKHIPAETK